MPKTIQYIIITHIFIHGIEKVHFDLFGMDWNIYTVLSQNLLYYLYGLVEDGKNSP